MQDDFAAHEAEKAAQYFEAQERFRFNRLTSFMLRHETTVIVSCFAAMIAGMAIMFAAAPFMRIDDGAGKEVLLLSCVVLVWGGFTTFMFLVIRFDERTWLGAAKRTIFYLALLIAMSLLVISLAQALIGWLG